MLLQVLLQVPGMQDLVEALASYTQRHFTRIDRLVRSSFLLDYTLASMNVLMPEAESDAAAADALDQLESADTDVDDSTGTGVDTQAFMQPTVGIPADADVQAVTSQQQQLGAEAATDSIVQEPASQLQEAADQMQDDSQQELEAEVKTRRVASGKRRKSAPQPASSSPAAVPAKTNTAAKPKRKKAKQ